MPSSSGSAAQMGMHMPSSTDNDEGYSSGPGQSYPKSAPVSVKPYSSKNMSTAKKRTAWSLDATQGAPLSLSKETMGSYYNWDKD